MISSKKKKVLSVILSTAATLLSLVVIVLVIALTILQFRTINNSTENSKIYAEISTDEKYATAVSVDNVSIVKQELSGGYAVIKMFSEWTGKEITESSLYEFYGKTDSLSSENFCDAMNKQFPEYKTTLYQDISAKELIARVYDSLQCGIPVPFEWAAQYNDQWTIQYSLITGIDVPENKITVANPYGYFEELSVEEFLGRTTYNETYADMPFVTNLGFAFGIFKQNTIFIATPVQA